MKKIHYTDNYLLNPYHPLTVYVIGTGGTGCQVLTSLARINSALWGLGHIGINVTAFDNDVVTPSNLGRQLFSPLEVGANKAEVLITRINRFFGYDWDAEPTAYPMSKGTTANIVVTCVDNVKTRMEIGKFLRSERNENRKDEERVYYWLDFGNSTDMGQAVLGTAEPIKQPDTDAVEAVSTLPCVDEMFDFTKVDEKDSGPSCSLVEALRKQDLFINSALSNLGCSLLWKLISQGSVEYHGMFLNLKTMKTNPIAL